MDVDQTVRTFVQFFEDRGHQRVTGGTLIPPPGDPVLYTTSGMHPLTRTFSGARTRSAGDSSASSAACAPPTWTRSATVPT